MCPDCTEHKTVTRQDLEIQDTDALELATKGTELKISAVGVTGSVHPRIKRLTHALDLLQTLALDPLVDQPVCGISPQDPQLNQPLVNPENCRESCHILACGFPAASASGSSPASALRVRAWIYLVPAFGCTPKSVWIHLWGPPLNVWRSPNDPSSLVRPLHQPIRSSLGPTLNILSEFICCIHPWICAQIQTTHCPWTRPCINPLDPPLNQPWIRPRTAMKNETALARRMRRPDTVERGQAAADLGRFSSVPVAGPSIKGGFTCVHTLMCPPAGFFVQKSCINITQGKRKELSERKRERENGARAEGLDRAIKVVQQRRSVSYATKPRFVWIWGLSCRFCVRD